MSSRTVLINTDADGVFEYERPMFGLINAAQLIVGDMDTGSLLVTVTDATRDVDLFSFGEISDDAYYQPAEPLPVYGDLLVTVVNGGDTKHGSLRLMTDT